MVGLWLLVTGLGCRAIDPAPDDLDGLVHWTFAHYADADDAELADAVVNLDAVIGALDDVVDGTLLPLTVDEAGAVPREVDLDPAGAQGLYLTRTFACTLADLEPILVHLEQDVLYDGVYDSYDRAYTSDLDAFSSREEPFLGWEVDYTASLLGASYDSHLLGGLRYLPELDAERSPWGPALVSRVFIPRPAEFAEGSNKSMDQDYQIEVFWEREPGTIAHVYGMWRQADYGNGLTLEDTTVQRILLNNLSDWDDNTERLCAEGLPQR